MVFSDDFLHFLKIKKTISCIHQNYLVALKGVLLIFALVPQSKCQVDCDLYLKHLVGYFIIMQNLHLSGDNASF